MGRAVSWLLLIAGALGTWFALVSPAANVIAARSWTEESCEITGSSLSSTVTRDPDPASTTGPTTTYALDLEYRYIIGGQEYQSSRYSFLDGIATSNYGRKSRILSKYSRGSVVPCFVDPQNHGSAVLNRGFTAEMLLGLIPLFILALGLLGSGLIPSSIGESAAETLARLAEERRAARLSPPPPSFEGNLAYAGSADVRTGFQAALVLTGMALWKLVTSLGDEVSDQQALALNLLAIGALTYGYRRGSLTCALGLFAYPGAVMTSALVFDFWPRTPSRITSLLAPNLNVPAWQPFLAEGPQQLAAYVREVAMFSILLVPIAILLSRAIRQMIKRQEASPVPTFALVGGPTVLYVLFVFGAGVSSHLAPAESPYPTGLMSVPEIAAALDAGDSSAWQRACEQAQSQTSLPASMAASLLRAASSPEIGIRGACLAAAGRLGAGGRDFLPILYAAVKDPSDYIRQVGAASLAEIGLQTDPERSLEAVVGLVADPDMRVRENSAIALARFEKNPEVVVPALRGALKDPAFGVRDAAARSLLRLGAAAAPATPELTKALSDVNPGVRTEAAEALGAIGVEAREAIPALRAAAHDPSGELRIVALNALARVEAPSSPLLVNELVAGLADPEDRVRGVAIASIEKLGPAAAAAVPSLIGLLSQRPIYLRLFAVQALAAIGPDAKAAIPRLKELLTEKVVTDESEAAQIPAAVRAALDRIAPGG